MARIERQGLGLVVHERIIALYCLTQRGNALVDTSIVPIDFAFEDRGK